MLCQNCGSNEANVKYTQIINGVKKQMNLCESCAKKLGIDNMTLNMPSIDFSNFLGGMFDDDMSAFFPSLIKPETLLCEKCGSSYEDFIDSGKFGCDECYNTFTNQIDALLKNIHGANRHVGRDKRMIGTSKIEKADKTNVEGEKNEIKKETSKEEKNQNKLKELQERLKQEIKEERYEDAAKTRDEIKKMEAE